MNAVPMGGIEVVQGSFETGFSDASACAYSISDVPGATACHEGVSERPGAIVPVCGEKVELDVDVGGCVDVKVPRGR